VTLVGSGGVGKTRCALQVAAKSTHTFDAVWLVELAPIADASLVASTIAQALGVPLSPNRAPLDTVVGYLKHKKVQLVLDNCEHVVDEVRNVAAAILHACPDVHILSTSREALHVAGEDVYRLPSLELVSAVRLFAERALSVEKRFVLSDESKPHVEEICRRLDGIPLAIELAAARVNVLSPQQLVRHLDERFRVLTGGDRSALARHQTMRALFDWSYDLLTPKEKKLFGRLAVFSGGWTLQNASIICADTEADADAAIEPWEVLDLLSSLVDKSLVVAEPLDEEKRYRFLESTRAYARDRLTQSGENERLARAHAAAYLKVALQVRAVLNDDSVDTLRARAKPEIENWRTALDWALRKRGDVAVGQRLVVALRPVWIWILRAEGLYWVHQALDTVGDETPTDVVADLHYTDAVLEHEAKRNHDAAERALARYRELGDQGGIGWAQISLGVALVELGQIAEGETMLKGSLEQLRDLQDTDGVIYALLRLSIARQLSGDLSTARSLLAEALAACEGDGYEKRVSHIKFQLAETEFRDGNAESAVRLAREALLVHRKYGNRVTVAAALCNMAAYLTALDRHDEAQTAAREALAAAVSDEHPLSIAFALQHLAAVAALRPACDGEEPSDLRTRAARLIGFVDARLSQFEYRRPYTDGSEYERITTALREQLGESNFSRFTTAGAAWSEERAVKEALVFV
jgi:predicted ATPase